MSDVDDMKDICKKIAKNPVIMCEVCEKRFYDYGYICLDLMNCVANLDRVKRLVFYTDDDKDYFNTVKFLEKKQYVISTECGNEKIIIKMNHDKCDYIKETSKICWCNHVAKRGRPKKSKEGE